MDTILRTFSITSASCLVLWPAVLAALVLLAVACGGDLEPTATSTVPPANADPGMEVLITTGCGGCHSIDGLAQASGQTGPTSPTWAAKVRTTSVSPSWVPMR
jgi:mono/diheme cytochrome c family protein